MIIAIILFIGGSVLGFRFGVTYLSYKSRKDNQQGLKDRGTEIHSFRKPGSSYGRILRRGNKTRHCLEVRFHKRYETY